jgi:ABC-type transport system involved in multi-copper enzyme maturation permease subunit
MEHRQKTPTNWALVIGIINFILLIIVITSIASLGSKINKSNDSSNANTPGANVSGQNVNILQSLTDLNQKVTELSTSPKKQFTYLSCNGSITNMGSSGSTTSTCYPY